MKRIATIGLLALGLIGTVGMTGYSLVRTAAAPPECCQKKESCCPGSSCCPKGEHAPGASCALHR